VCAGRVAAELGVGDPDETDGAGAPDPPHPAVATSAAIVAARTARLTPLSLRRVSHPCPVNAAVPSKLADRALAAPSLGGAR